MLFSVARNLTKCGSSFQISKQHGTVESDVWIEAPFLTALRQHQHQRRRAYANLTSHLAKTSNSKFSPRFYSNSSVSTSPKIGFFKWYLRMLETRPLITKCLSSSLIYTLADITSQLITLPSYDSFDSTRTLRISAYGMLIMGPSQHLWFNFVSRILTQSDVFTTLKKIVMGQVIGPCEGGDEIVARLKRDLLPTVKNGLMYWPMCDFLMFKFVPVYLQPLVNSSFVYLWIIYLTYMANLKKVDAS
ncbi:hypothetical protein Nepgr_005012 [Nepenthes gracilis]|uniref:PXMP2/4 family protein 4 n=1 Tax=Nepenthes gracilis TaxID=150966 RepID=A0AAD3S2E6_NEPGR|nr:hypothetical protein Nepgr_005012 [Nepenthes gracilis]